MSSRNVRILAVVVLALFGVLFALNSTDRSDSQTGAQMLFPEIKSRLNDLNVVTITDADGTITLEREAEDDSAAARWISSAHDGYPADTGKLRQLLLAIADARKLEQKTADPELYERLGVADPREDGGNGVLVSARGNDAAVSVILGDTAQQEFRYARLPDEEQSWLIDQNPDLPGDSTGWLLPEIVDIAATRIQSVIIRHADGEEVRIGKENADAANFELENIPEDEELRYPSVANGIAGVLGNLALQDVRKGDLAGEDASTAEFRTFDGLELLVRIGSRAGEANAGDGDDGANTDEEEHWITLEASADDAVGDSPDADEGEEPVEDADSSAGEAPQSAEANGEDGAPGGQEASEGKRDPADEAAEINDRVSGWSYRIAGYKADQLTRRLADLLSEEEDPPAE
ncbi:MAG TPA: DUF4340 domain-containing protein [Woeseiaceae bacterium]|nr:DUF4340 domain-containing protein [Woeseiaceae bacterium]